MPISVFMKPHPDITSMSGSSSPIDSPHELTDVIANGQHIFSYG